MRYAESAEAQTEMRRAGLVLPGILDQASAVPVPITPAFLAHDCVGLSTMPHLVF